MIGIDAVEIERFKDFAQHEDEQLAKLFSQNEIAYCLSEPILSAERFAAHFAAKEACYKALSTLGGTHHSFLSSARHIELFKNPKTDAPGLHIDWTYFGLRDHQAHISITHTRTTALAMVLLQ